MEYPKLINLIKLETLEDAPIPQEKRFPSGNIVARGYLFEHTYPKIGVSFVVMKSKLGVSFITSVVKSIDKKTDNEIEFTTLNSRYKIVIKEPVEHEFKKITKKEVEQNRSKAYKYE